jgi:hypothetical protein
MNGEIFFLKESQAQLCQNIYDLINAQIHGIDIARTAIVPLCMIVLLDIWKASS